ncbi:Protein of unknown function [Novosphingobium panipatense]|uniref:DUF3617 family protein n=3 Tax=Novosphingobium panipatense TaxID=428991 RepID=A0ABY1Q7C5_9SPHN|nr:Protein of unknown function [Novosphingobium panipatense]
MMAALAGLALSGCGSEDTADGAPRSEADLKKEVAKLDAPEPGQYRQVLEVTRLDLPGLPPEAAEQMKTAMADKQETLVCITQADADKGYRDMFKDVRKGSECAYSRFEVNGGKLDAQMDCKAAGQGQMVMKLAGTLGPNRSDVTIDVDPVGNPLPGQGMKMTLRLTTTRVGDCPAS